MTITLPLETMSVSDKIQIMENIWQSFRQNPSEVESPAWHNDVLSARQTRASNGTSQYDDWDKVKQHIRCNR